MAVKIFYIEDEPNLAKVVKETLEKQSYDIVWETDGAKVMGHFATFKPDICVLDIMLPNIDGYTLCKQIREKHQSLPIIFLTAKTETKDLIKGFEAGGTDYVRKPFSIEELIARIENQISIHQNKIDPGISNHEILLGSYSYSPKKYELKGPLGIIKLSQREKQIFDVFAFSVNKIIDRKELLLDVWGDDSFFNSRNLDVYIRKLRSYFKDDQKIQIKTLKGKGYLFLIEEDPG